MPVVSALSHLPVMPQAAVENDAPAVAPQDAIEAQADTDHAASEATLREGTWQALIQGDELAALELAMVGDEECSQVAHLCLQHAGAHPEAVKRMVYMNENVRDEAFKLLRVDVQCDPEQRMALALCILDAGYALPGELLAPEVASMLVERTRAETEYWGEMRDKHGASDGKPFFYQDTKYSRSNLNGKLSSLADPGNLFWCRHMETAAAENTKAYLQNISKPIPDVRTLNYQALDASEKLSRAAPTINFSPSFLGKLLVRLALDAKLGETRSFRVGWLAAGDGHGMRIFLEKTRDGFFKVGLYEPNVSGNISHLKVLPEKLANLKFDDFDTLKVARGAGRFVLALEVESPALAESCVGSFVARRHYVSQIDNLGQALAHGNLSEMDSSLAALRTLPVEPAAQDLLAARLADAMCVALSDGRGAAVTKLMAGLRHLSFTEQQIAVIVSASPAPAPTTTPAGPRPLPVGLHSALNLGHADAVEAFMTGLRGLQLEPAKLEPAQIAQIVAANDHDQRPGLYAAMQGGHARAVAKYMTGLKDLGLDSAQAAAIAAAKRKDGTPALYKALETGHVAAVNEFVQGLKALGLTPDQVAEIIMASPGSTPGLHNALYHGRTVSVETLLSSLAGAGLTAEQNAEIASAKNGTRIPGLYAALERGQGAVAQTFLQNLHHLDLPAAQLCDVIMARNALSTPALHLALSNGNGRSVQGFMQGFKSVVGLGLTPEHVAEILAAKDPQHGAVPALNVALQKGNARAIKEFMAGLQGAGRLLTRAQLVDIVVARDSGHTPGLYAAFANGKADAVEAFLEGLPGLGGSGGLTREDFAEIVSARPHDEDPSGPQVARERGHTEAVEKFDIFLSRSGLLRPPTRFDDATQSPTGSSPSMQRAP